MEFLQSIFANPILGIGIPAIIFAIGFVMLLKRTPGFLYTLFLLTIVLASAFAMLNHKVVSEYFHGDTSDARWEQLRYELDDFKNQMFESIQELREDLSNDPDTAEIEDARAVMSSLQGALEELEGSVEQAALELSTSGSSAQE